MLLCEHKKYVTACKRIAWMEYYMQSLPCQYHSPDQLASGTVQYDPVLFSTRSKLTKRDEGRTGEERERGGKSLRRLLKGSRARKAIA